MGRSSKPRQFFSIEHLSEEAVAAFVDGEMPPRAQRRVLRHLVHCDECRRDVKAQRDAAQRMREAANEPVHMSTELLHKLAAIPTNCDPQNPSGSPAKTEQDSPGKKAQATSSPHNNADSHRTDGYGAGDELGELRHENALSVAKSAAFGVMRTVENGAMSAMDTVGEYADQLRCAWKDRSNSPKR
ncbi:zf-HC2 domain-containing protein [uncultured Corynebacterium sp.]|uniref:anti-sigma factor family protein n=1 Tax=uncultured Corynebacterium sp. TaxID=159447 RepID=UPI0025F531DA|nr:zf-HC2 domain-containing protein [uncultured Corynebacterium sp.]